MQEMKRIIEQTVNFAADFFRLDKGLVCGQCKRKEYAMARHTVWYYLHVECKVPVSALSRYFSRTIRMIFFGISNIRNGLHFHRTYKDMYENFVKEQGARACIEQP